MSETVQGFCLDAEKAYREDRLQDAIDALDGAINLVYDDMEAQVENSQETPQKT